MNTRWLAALLLAALALFVAGCGGDDGGDSASSETSVVETEATDDDATETEATDDGTATDATEDDGVLGLRSTALKFGRATKPWVALLYLAVWVAITVAGIVADAGFVFLIGVLAAGAHLVWQIATLDIDDAENCLQRFRSNRDFGAIVLAAIVLDMALAASL